MRIASLPAALRLAAFSLALAVLLWLSLAPTDALPKVSFWDKAEHALAYLVLTALGLLLFPGRVRALTLGALALGVAIEVLQANMDLGRQGDWRDVVGDAVGIGAALGLLAVGRGIQQRR